MKIRNPKYPFKERGVWDNCPECFEDFSLDSCTHCGSGFDDEYIEVPSEIEQLRQRVAELESLLKEAYADADEVLRPRVAELEKEQQWQPIETAPKGTFVLLAGPSGYTTIETVFATGRMCSDYHKGRWIDHANDDLTDWGFVPTHWMPLPYVPAIASVKEKA